MNRTERKEKRKGKKTAMWGECEKIGRSRIMKAARSEMSIIGRSLDAKRDI